MTRPLPVDPPNEAPVNPLYTHPASPFLRTHVLTPVAFASPPATPPQASAWVVHRAEIEIGLAVLAYLMILVGAVVVVRSNPMATWRFDVAALPALPAGVALWLFSRWVNRLTELQKRIQIQATTFALGAAALVGFGYGFLEGAGMPQLNLSVMVPILVLLWGIGTLIFTLRHR
jgi:hypothetical protein